MEPCAGYRPVAPNRPRRKLQDFGDILNAKAPEELHFHDLALAFVLLRQAVEGLIECEQFGWFLLNENKSVLKRNRFARTSALERSVVASVVNQNLTHESGSDGNEVGTILPFRLTSTCHAQKRLVNQRCRLEGVVAPFPAEVKRSQPPKLPINQGY
jgi:hypothetical protein